MSHACTIGGEPVTLAWVQSSARAMRFRAGKIGENPAGLWTQLRDPVRGDYAAGVLLWLLAPADLHKRHETPDSLWESVTDEELPDVLAAIVGTLGDSIPPEAEKKSSSRKSPSPESNSD